MNIDNNFIKNEKGSWSYRDMEALEAQFRKEFSNLKDGEAIRVGLLRRGRARKALPGYPMEDFTVLKPKDLGAFIIRINERKEAYIIRLGASDFREILNNTGGIYDSWSTYSFLLKETDEADLAEILSMDFYALKLSGSPEDLFKAGLVGAKNLLAGRELLPNKDLTWSQSPPQVYLQARPFLSIKDAIQWGQEKKVQPYEEEKTQSRSGEVFDSENPTDSAELKEEETEDNREAEAERQAIYEKKVVKWAQKMFKSAKTGSLRRMLKIPKGKTIWDVYTPEELARKYKKGSPLLRKKILPLANLGKSHSPKWQKFASAIKEALDPRTVKAAEELGVESFAGLVCIETMLDGERSIKYIKDVIAENWSFIPDEERIKLLSEAKRFVIRGKKGAVRKVFGLKRGQKITDLSLNTVMAKAKANPKIRVTLGLLAKKAMKNPSSPHFAFWRRYRAMMDAYRKETKKSKK